MLKVGRGWRGLCKAGGLCFLVNGVIFLIVLPLELAFGQPASVSDTLVAISAQDFLYRTAVGLEALAPVFLVPGALALYVSLGELKRVHMILATALFGLATVFFLGGSVLFYSLSDVAKAYLTAPGDPQRSAFLAAGLLAWSAANVAVTAGSFLFSVAVFLVGVVSLNEGFGRIAAYLSLIVGVLGMIGSVPTPILTSIGFISEFLLIPWFLLIGYKLFKVR